MKLSGSVIVQVLVACAYARPSCDESEYFDRKDKQCKTCSMECPTNQIILRPCGQFSDTKCGPFIFEWPPAQQTQPTKPPIKATEEKNCTDGLSCHQWFTIAMVLLGILCFICVCIAVYIVVVCFCRNTEDKEIIYNPVYVQTQAPEEPRYVEVFSSSRDRLKGHSQLMRMNTGSVSTFQSTSALPLLHTQNSENIYVNCMEYLPEVYTSNKSKDTNDYVYLDSN